jgi:hypothetical protein
MSLLLNGAKTMTIAGTEMQCLEIYTGEAYTLPLNFTYANGNPANALVPNAWALSTSAKFYTVDTVSYPNVDEVVLGNITLLAPQPSTGSGTYSPNLIAAFSNASAGTGYLYIPDTLSGGSGSPNPTPTIGLANTTANSTLVIVTLQISKQSTANASLAEINKEPLGFIIRYQ